MSMEFKDIAVPDKLNMVVEESLKKVQEEQKEKRKKTWIARGCGMAAVLACGIMVGVANPSFATNLPLVGHIFETMQDKFSYGGDYNGIGEALEDNSEAVSMETGEETGEQTAKYTQTVDGVTVTLSEVYCNKQALYLTLEIHSEEAFPDMYEPQLFTSEQYSFNPTMLGDAVVLNGDLVDANTYAGLVRFDLNDKNVDTSEVEKAAIEAKEKGEDWNYDADDPNFAEHIQVVEIPDTFTLDLTIDQIRGMLKNPPVPDYGKTDEELEQMSDEEWNTFMTNWYNEHPDFEDSGDAIYNGPWTFSFDVTINDTDTQVVDLSDKAENGIGFSKITKDRFEITVYGLNTMPEDMGEYFPVLLDADGRLMSYGDGGSVNTVAINESDVSTVDVLLIEENLWLNDLKGEWWKTENGLTNPDEIKAFKELLLEKCAYHTQVHFE
ncbi:MAG: DUF4179 domain-containing protein [Lachnospiraceae bacterium]